MLEPKHPLLASTGRSVDQQATRRSRADPGYILNSGRLSGSQGVTPSLKVTEAWWPVVAFSRCIVIDGLGPFRQEGLDQAFRLRVGLRCVRLDADRLEPQFLTGFSPISLAVGGNILREHPATVDPPLREPAKRPGQELSDRSFFLVGEHLDVVQAGGVVDGDVDRLVAGTSKVDLRAITGDMMTLSL